MYCGDCPEENRKRLSKVEGVLEVLVTNYVETPYGVVQVFYDSHQVSRDEVLARVGLPTMLSCWRTRTREESRYCSGIPRPMSAKVRVMC